jgi:hypothetical protein
MASSGEKYRMAKRAFLLAKNNRIEENGRIKDRKKGNNG